ncbi:helix-turn-helix transcriptional regulator [Jeotgalibacillus sp. ET6]|uniref:helix-turn-helix domain-containing protein n=1 Tax=Jeotgalibacillus sp. ET6 TaxID=3037260 RepID=UPI00241890F2|nr:helix-turn-helix transcriptional regulator [Jeotgalibacillus sp. ET6]MDG5471129.1 helix-turn-helix transcriptional regulator [Jeotgalibacillus sp. ET6]
MNELGERIKELRKEKGMTLVEVAGDQLTKGMLSLIENGKAKPSMESLAHIARQLGVDVHLLLEERSTEEIKQLLVQIEDQIEEAEKEFSIDKVKHLLQKIYEKISPLFNQKLPTTYETGRLYELGGRCLLVLERSKEGHEAIEESVRIYESLSLFNQALKAKIRFLYEDMKVGSFEKALDQIEVFKKEYKDKNIVIEPVVQIELDYAELIILYGLGEYGRGREVLTNLIKYSKQKRVYYLMDDIYRLAAFHALVNKDEENFNHYILKSRQFALFTDNDETLGYALFIEAHYHNEYTKDHDQALSILADLKELIEKVGESLGGNFYLEKGKAFYGKGMIDEALEQFEFFEHPSYATHPFDLAMIYTIDSYRALCFAQKGQREKAIPYAEKAVAQLSTLPHSPYHDFAKETLVQLQNQ